MRSIPKSPLWRYCMPLLLVGAAATSAVAQTDVHTANKQLARAAFDKVLIAGEFDAAEQFFRDDYIQHNPDVPTGRAGLVGYLKAFRKQFPSQTVKVMDVVAEGDKVTIFSVWEIANPKQRTRQKLHIADLFRVEGGKLAEHWDVIQVLSSPGK
jgi:predicted SnoaL-like aldol condensation-catalyzing enzyme